MAALSWLLNLDFAGGSTAGSAFKAYWAEDSDELVYRMKKNVAGQVIGVQMISASDGSAFTSTVTLNITKDGGTQASSGGTGPTHEGNGFFTYVPTQAETNADHIGFTFTGSGAIPKTVQVYTSFPQTGDAYAEATSGVYGLSAIKGYVDDIGVAGAGLTAVPWNAAWASDVTASVWNQARSGYTTAGTFGEGVGSVQGNVTGSVGSVSTNGITAASIATDAVTEIQSGLATASSISGLNNISTTDVKNQVVAALSTDTYAEPGQSNPAATATLAVKINYLYKAWRNKVTQTSSEYKLFNDDGTTVGQKASVSDNGTTFERGEIGTGP